MRLTLEELKILESELRVVDPVGHKELTKKQEEKLFDQYDKLVNKLTDEIDRRESKKKHLTTN